jgi:myo-inositol-1(or 4)-monophosphatase
MILELIELGERLRDLRSSAKNSITNKTNKFGFVELVSDADIFAQNELIYLLREKKGFVGNIISEELDNHDITPKRGSKSAVIDPIDGTHNFVFGLPMWGVTCSLFDEKQEIYESYIVLPDLNVLYSFDKGEIFEFTFAAGKIVKSTRLKAPPGNNERFAISFENQVYKNPDRFHDMYKRLASSAFTTRISGASSFDIAMIVKGALNGRIWLSSNFYDIAPAFAFIGKGGGHLININTGKPAGLDDKDLIGTFDLRLYELLDENRVF